MESETQSSVLEAAGRHWKSQAFASHRLEIFLFLEISAHRGTVRLSGVVTPTLLQLKAYPTTQLLGFFPSLSFIQH